MMDLYVEAIGLCAPGMDGWPAGREVLRGACPFTASPMILPECDLLPAAERRRAVPSVKLALGVANEAVRASTRNPATLATVFSSSVADGRTIHEILQVLATSGREISPTRFHNSVHNAAAGYWHIASKSREASTSLCSRHASFAAGLLESATRVTVGNEPVLLVVYDVPFPPPLDAQHPISSSFGVALLLAAVETGQSLARMGIELVRGFPITICTGSLVLEELRAGNPAARCLPILAALACGEARTVYLDYANGNALSVSITPQERQMTFRNGQPDCGAGAD